MRIKPQPESSLRAVTGLPSLWRFTHIAEKGMFPATVTEAVKAVSDKATGLAHPTVLPDQRRREPIGGYPIPERSQTWIQTHLESDWIEGRQGVHITVSLACVYVPTIHER